MKNGQRKSLAKWKYDVFSQFQKKVKSHNVVDFCSSRRMRRLAKKKGYSDNIEASRNYVRDFKDFIDNKKNRRNENDTSTNGRHYA